MTLDILSVKWDFARLQSRDLLDARDQYYWHLIHRHMFHTPGKWIVNFAILLLLASIAPSVSATEEDSRVWDNTDKLLAATALIATTVDWAQTRYIARHPRQYRELNPILGQHPSTGKVDRYFALSIVAGSAIAIALPSKYRKVWLGGITLVEVGFVIHNHHIGIRADF